MVVMQRELDRSVRRSLRQLLLWVGAMMALLCLLLGGLVLTQQASLRTVFDDRVVPLHELQRIGHTLNITIPAELDSPVVEAAALSKLKQRVRDAWQRYLLTYLTEEEQRLAERAGARLQAVLEAAALEQASGYQRALQGFNATLGPLLELQVRVAEQEMERARRIGGWSLVLAGACALACALLLLRVWLLLQAKVVAPVRVVADALAGLSEGGGDLGPEARALSGDFAEVGEHLRLLQHALGEARSRPAKL